jgi:oligosaccharyltransferase complex subunit beta
LVDKQWKKIYPKDVQLEVTMLDPYIRRTLAADLNGVLKSKFMLPDHYGIFTLRVDYQRLGYSYLKVEETIQLRPFRHDQYPRFISQAYPYYFNIFSMMVACFVFTLVFLFYQPKQHGAKLKLE